MSDSRSPSKLVTSTPAAQQRKGVEAEQHRRSSEFRLEEQEKNYQALLKDKKESEKALNDKIQSLQEVLADVRAQNVRLSTQAQYADEKEKLLQVHRFIFF